MTSYELINVIDKLMTTFDGESQILRIASGLSALFEKLISLFADIVGLSVEATSDKAVAKMNNLSKFLTDDARPYLKDVQPRTFFVEISYLESMADQFYEVMNEAAVQTTPNIKQRLERLSKGYEEYLKNDSDNNAVKLLIIGRDLHVEVDTVKKTLNLVRERLVQETRLPNEKKETLSLVLYSEVQFTKLVQKLNAIDSIYLELCELLGISPKEYPLQIVKVESGSLWAKLFGESKLTAFMISLIESGISFLHRNYTKEGQIITLPKKVEAIATVLELEQKLKEAGINTDELKENIQKSSVILSRSLSQLLEGEPVVKVNERLYSVGAEVERAYLKQSDTLLLEEGSQEREKDS